MNTDVDTAARGRGDAVSGGRSTQPLRPRGPQERSGAGKPDSPAAGSRNTESPARPQHFFSRNERCRLRFQSASHDQLSSAQLSSAPPRTPALPRDAATAPRSLRLCGSRQTACGERSGTERSRLRPGAAGNPGETSPARSPGRATHWQRRRWPGRCCPCPPRRAAP